MKRGFYILTIMATALCVPGCQKTDGSHKGKASNTIRANVIVDKTKSSAGADLPGRFISERVVSSADGFELIETVYENELLPSERETKGTVVTSDNIEEFNMMAYAEDEWYDNTIKDGEPGSPTAKNPAGKYFEAGCTKNGSSWDLAMTGGPAKPGDSGELFWLNGVPMTFWSWNAGSLTRDNIYKAHFEFTVNENVLQQKDLLYAFSKESRTYHDNWDDDYGKLESESSTSGASGENINVHFYHALSAVQFIRNSSLTDYEITGIEIQNINSHTVCDIESNDNVPVTGGTSNMAFSHTPDTPAAFSQTYDSEDPSLDEPSDAATNGRFKPGDNKTFFMIPQTLGAEDADAPSAALKVSFVYKGTGASGSETTSPVFALASTIWEAGKYYVYKVDLAGNIHVAISEQCPANVKSDVKFQNTSNVNEYIRAAVIGNWYDASGNIVAAWDKTRDGDITLGIGWTENGGFYYHTSPVASKEFTGNLFDSFTQPSGASAPVTGAHFEMTILVQAVASDGIASCTVAF